jgi:pyridoxal 5'-phosphate synthase pdxS subunit
LDHINRYNLKENEMAKANGRSNGKNNGKPNGKPRVQPETRALGEVVEVSRVSDHTPDTGANLWRVKVGLAEMLKGGVIMDVTNVEQAEIAEKAGACAVMALERVPSDIRKEGGVARMASTKIIREIMDTVSIPVMAKVRIGHFAEAQVLQALEVDFIDESEVLTPADEENHVWKHDFRVPFVCGARNLGEALRRIAEGAAMIRTKGEAGSGNIVEAVRHIRAIVSEMRRLTTLRGDELVRVSKDLGAPLDLIRQIAETGKLPVPNFSAGGIATPADAALVRQLGAEAVFVGSGIFKSADPAVRAKAIVKAATHFNDPKAVLEASEELGEAMKGLDIRQMDEKDMLQTRGW